MKKIILIGYMGSGKSTIAQLLSEKLGILSFDLDVIIEKKTSLTVLQLFKQRGEVYFRKLEHQLLLEFVNTNKNMVLSLGGGTPCYANNHLLLNGNQVVSIYLKASIDTLYNRLIVNKDIRPLITNLEDNKLKEFIAKNLFDRSFYYNHATFNVNVDDKSPSSIADEIIELLT
jgi:shikimate kinase